MKLLQIEQFLDFRCIADKCPYTCCREWEILFDEDKVNKYKDWGYESALEKSGQDYKIKFDEYGKCPLLNEQGLCSIVINHGEEALSYICNTFPRLYKRRENILEFSLSNACTEVIRMLRETSGQITFVLDDMEADIPMKNDFSNAYYLCRDMIVDLLQIQGIPLWIRLYLAYKFSQNINPDDAEQMKNVLEQYNSVDYIIGLYRQLLGFSYEPAAKLQLCLDLMTKVTAGTEKWDGYARYIKPILEKIPQTPIEELIAGWEEYKPYREGMEQLYENILVNMAFQNGISGNNDAFFSKQIVILCIEYSVMVLAVFFNWYYAGRKLDECTENNILAYCAKRLEHQTVSTFDRLLQTICEDGQPNGGQIVLWTC